MKLDCNQRENVFVKLRLKHDETMIYMNRVITIIVPIINLYTLIRTICLMIKCNKT